MYDKKLFTCVNGPFADEQLALDPNHPYTLHLTIKGRKGYYTIARQGVDQLIWIPC